MSASDVSNLREGRWWCARKEGTMRTSNFKKIAYCCLALHGQSWHYPCREGCEDFKLTTTLREIYVVAQVPKNLMSNHVSAPMSLYIRTATHPNQPRSGWEPQMSVPVCSGDCVKSAGAQPVLQNVGLSKIG